MGKKKNNLKAAIIITVFVSLVAFGVVSYSYTSFVSVEQTEVSKETSNDENFLHKYMKSIYGRLSNSDD